MLKSIVLRLMLLFMLNVVFWECSRKLQSTPDSAKIEGAEISDGHFLYRPIIIFGEVVAGTEPD